MSSRDTLLFCTDGRGLRPLVLAAGSHGVARAACAFLRALGTALALCLAASFGAGAQTLPVAGETRTSLPDGRVLVLGGAQATSRAALVDPVTGAKTPLGSGLATARHEHAATLLPDGKVLITGGRDAGGTVITSAERFDPATAQFSTVSDLGVLARAGHVTRMLPDGRLILIGGRAPDGSARVEAEILDLKTGRVDGLGRVSGLDRSDPLVQPLTNGDFVISAGRDARGAAQVSSLRYRWRTQDFVELTPADLAALPWPEPRDRVPYVVGSHPAADTVDADPQGIVVARLSQPADPRSVNTSTIALIGPGGAIAAIVTPSDDGMLVFVVPTQPLQPGTRYALVARGLRSSASLAMPVTTVAFITRDLGSVAASAGTAGAGNAAAVPRSLLGGGILGGGAPLPGPDGILEVPDTLQVAPQAEDDDEIFVPRARHRMGRWRSERAMPRDIERRINDAVALKGGVAYENAFRGFRSALRLTRVTNRRDGGAAPTGVSGQVLRLNDKPLANVEVSVGTRRTRTDAEGRFEFIGLAPGRVEIFVDGAKAGRDGVSYGKFVVGADVEAGEMTEVAPVFVPRIRATDWVDIPNPVRRDLVVTHPNVPGMEIRIPKGAVLRERDGTLVTKLALLPMPVDRAPMPFPDNAPTFVSVQPGGLTVQGLDPARTRGVRVIYPNSTNDPPGLRSLFWKYDPKDKGWYVYGDGYPSADGTQIVPSPGVEVYDTIGFMRATTGNGPSWPDRWAPPECAGGGNNPPDRPCPPPSESKSGGSGEKSQGPCGQGGDPVDCSTGLFTLTRTDLTAPDITPLAITRTYRPRDSVSRAFGFGTGHPFAIYLNFTPAPTPAGNIDAVGSPSVRMIMADGSPHLFDRVPNSSPAAFEYNGPIAELKKATISLLSTLRSRQDNPNPPDAYGYRWIMQRRDGTRLEFASDINGFPLLDIADRNHNRVQFVYIGGVVTRIVSASGRSIDLTYDPSKRITQAIDHTGRTVSYQYYSTSPTNPACPAADAGNAAPAGYLCKVTDSLNASETYRYDSTGRMLSITDKRGNTLVTNTYDANDRVVTQVDALGGTTSFVYTLDSNGKVTQTDVTDPRSLVTRMIFNTDGRLLSRIEATGTAKARTTSYEYHPVTKLLSAEVDPLGRRTETTYDTYGNVTQIKSLAGTASEFTRSFTWRTWSDHQLETATDPRGKITTFSYDMRGRMIQVADPLANLTKFSYNSQGLVTQVTDPRNQITQFGYSLTDLSSITDPLGRVTRFFTDPLGRVVQSTDPLGNKSTAVYDKLHRVTGSTDATGNTVQMSYDAVGNLATFTDARNSVTGFTYDAKNRLVTKTDALVRSDSFTYDGNDNLLTVTDRKGQVTTHGYDELDRRTLTTWQGGATTAFSYDAGDRLTQVTDSVSGTITRTYDSRFDALATETVPLGAGTSTTTSTYDSAGRRTQVQVTGQTAVIYGFDDANRLTGITQGANAVGFTYDVASRRTQATLPNGVTIDYGYDNANQLTSLVYKRNGVTIGDLSYTYDNAGRRKTMGGTLARTNLPPALTSATYDANNRLTNWGGTAYGYDNNGNLTSDGTRTYTWDTRDRLTGLNGGGIASSYGYDAFNRRTTKTINAVQSGTLYDGFREVHTTSGSTIASTLLNGPGLDERYARTQSGNTHVFLPDALGSTLNLVSPGGALTATYTYEPYGMATQSGTDDTQYRYTGREDDGTGLMYYRARYYHPRVSRFISEDPIGLQGGYNVYAYVGGSPTNGTDPLGLFNPTKAATAAGNAIISGFSAASGGIKIAIAAGLTPAAATGVGALPPSALYAWGLWNLNSSRGAFQRARKQWHEALCERWTDWTFKNFWGLAPQGDRYDDPWEYRSPKEYVEEKGWWKALSEGGYF